MEVKNEGSKEEGERRWDAGTRNKMQLVQSVENNRKRYKDKKEKASRGEAGKEKERTTWCFSLLLVVPLARDGVAPLYGVQIGHLHDLSLSTFLPPHLITQSDFSTSGSLLLPIKQKHDRWLTSKFDFRFVVTR